MSYNGKNLTFGCQNEGVSTSISKARKILWLEWGDVGRFSLGQAQVFYGVLLIDIGDVGECSVTLCEVDQKMVLRVIWR